MILFAFALSLPISIPLAFPLFLKLLTALIGVGGFIYSLGANQSPRLPTGFLNSAAGDPAPGVPLTSPSGSIVQAYAGQVGAKLTVDTNEASGLSDPATATLLAGIYQYVQFLSSSTASNARGQIVFWNNAASYIVTPDVTLATQGLIAGITLAAVTKGNYGWIQIQGKANVKFKSSITKATPVAGDLVIVDQGGGTPTNTADILADATNITSPIAKSVLGVADANPTGGSLSVVDLAFVLNGWRY